MKETIFEYVIHFLFLIEVGSVAFTLVVLYKVFGFLPMVLTFISSILIVYIGYTKIINLKFKEVI